MSQRRVGQPVTQVRLTNVAIVRYKCKGKRFEIACYKNKVINWRNGVEKDIDEVLQSDRIFQNVISGIYASKKDLVKAFGHDNNEKICLEILSKGKEQVSGKEREVQLTKMFHEIATTVARTCVNPRTERRYPVNLIEKTMKEYHFNPRLNSNAKKQSLECIKYLQKKCPGFIRRADMKVRILVEPGAEERTETLESCLVQLGALKIEGGGGTKENELLYKFKPALYRKVHKCTQDHGRATLNVVDAATSSATTVDAARTAAAAPTSTSTLGADMIAEARRKKVTIVAPKSGSKSCRTCGGSFDVGGYRAHFKSQWHRYNLKAKGKGMPVLDEASFASLKETEVLAFFDT